MRLLRSVREKEDIKYCGLGEKVRVLEKYDRLQGKCEDSIKNW